MFADSNCFPSEETGATAVFKSTCDLIGVDVDECILATVVAHVVSALTVICGFSSVFFSDSTFVQILVWCRIPGQFLHVFLDLLSVILWFPKQLKRKCFSLMTLFRSSTDLTFVHVIGSCT